MSDYPEIVPEVANLDKFTFSLNASKPVKKQIESELNNLQTRIEKISDAVTVGDMPLVRFILQASHDRKELKKLAKAIDRVADLIEIHDKLQNKLNVIEIAEKDPNWFALAFGDFSEQLDKDILSIFNNKE
jgi:hypothetical protein